MTITAEDVQELFDEGWSKTEVSELSDISMSTLRRLIDKCDITVPVKLKKSKVIPSSKNGVPLPTGYGIPLMEQAKDILGVRMGESRDCYLLDGKPCSTRRIIEEAGLSFLDE